MKRLLTLALTCSLLLTACGQSAVSQPEETKAPAGDQQVEPVETPVAAVAQPDELTFVEVVPDFDNLDDQALLRYLGDKVYAELIDSMSNEDYFIENVSALYVSKEYLEELSYNSKENIFFGYTLAELDELFQGTRYVFTLGDDGETTVEPFEGYTDTYGQAIKNVAVGGGVILLCVTVSAVSAGAGAPAVSLIFAASAKTGSVMALSSGAISGIMSGIITGVKTKDFDQAVEAAALAASEGFKWGAITGAVSGGVSEAVALKGATLNGLTMNEAAAIQKESKYPLDVIKEFKSMEQYEICKEAGLTSNVVNGKMALVRDIDLNFMDEMGRTNLERMQQGLAALDPATGQSLQLHHIGQKADSTLAILTEAEHMQGGNNTIWHELGQATEVHGLGNNWDAQRQAFWKSFANAVS